MKNVPIRLKAKITLSSIGTVLRSPAYVVLSVASSLAIAGLIIWSLNLDLLWYILTEAPLNLLQKLEFFVYGYESIFTTFDSLLSVSIILFSVLFGMNIALLVYVIKNQGFKSIPKKSGGAGFTFAILGGGCIACGTSLLAPLLATAGAGSALWLRDLGTIFNLLGSLLIGYSIYKLSIIVATVRAEGANGLKGVEL
jgi:hypothetical protein